MIGSSVFKLFSSKKEVLLRLRAGVHIKTKEYMAPSKQDWPKPSAAILESLYINSNPRFSECAIPVA